MAFLNAITATAPTGLWYTILSWLEGLVHNYAVAIILLTVGVRLLMVPFDFANKYSGKKNARLQNKMKPELDKINQKYAGQRDIINQKTQEVYRRYKFNVGGMCFTMIVPMILSMIIFTSIFGALGSISRYETAKQFVQAREAYYSVYGIDANGAAPYAELAALTATMDSAESAAKKTEADAKALANFNENKESFLWIDNIWLADTPWSNPVLSYESFIKNTGIEETSLTQDEYAMIVNNIQDNTRNSNGYLIIVVLSVATSYLSTAINGWITKAKAKKKGINMDQVGLGGKGKLLMWFLPVVIGIIILFYNAAFAIYSTTGSLVLLITNPVMTLFIDMLEFEAIEQEEDRTMAPYDRKRK